MDKYYDTLILGPVSLDINIDHSGNTRKEAGGAVVQSGFAAARTGHLTAVFTKLNPMDADINEIFSQSGADVYWKESKNTTSIINRYFTEDKEKRECKAVSICDPFDINEIPKVKTKICHIAGLVYGDFSDEMLKELGKTGATLAVDAQCLLRHADNEGSMVYIDWEQKEKYLKYIDFFKTDAAEAEILTGESDRIKAARILHKLGAREIMITHNSEVMIFDGNEVYTCPIKARNLSGRTGRGDTCFSGYITERIKHDIPASLLFATALVSLKMETPGPFKGNREDVEKYIERFY